MYGYAGSSATASQLTPFSCGAANHQRGGTGRTSRRGRPSHQHLGRHHAGRAQLNHEFRIFRIFRIGRCRRFAQRSSTDLLNLGSGSNLASLLNGSSNSALGTFLNGNFFSTAVTNGALAGGPFNPQFILQSLAGFGYLQDAKGAAGASGLGLLNLFNPGALGSAGLPGLGGVGSGMSAAIGGAGHVGALSVPPSWSAVAPTSPIASALGGTPLAPPGPVAGGPGGVASPMSNMSGRLRRPVPKYGIRLPSVMARPPAAG